MDAAWYLDSCKIKLGISSNYALWKATEIPESYISDFYKGKRIPDEYACFKFAEILGLSPTLIIAEIQATNYKKPDKALFFKHFLTTAGLWITLAVIPLFLGAHSESVRAAGNAVVIDIKSHYAKLKRLFQVGKKRRKFRIVYV